MPTEITTPPGRIVWGHPSKAKPRTKQNSREPLLDATGQQRQSWSFGVAFDKVTFQNHIWPALAAEAATAFPQGTPPTFSWKYVDGDTIDREGKPYNQREGYAGCYVLAISTELMAPPIFKFNGTGYDQLPGESIKTGDFVVVGLNLKVNVPTDRTQTPGLYVNPTIVEFVGYGPEIFSQNAVDPMAALGGRTHALPPGASATPLAATGAPGHPMPMAAPGMMPGAPAPMAAPMAAPAPLPPPATNFIPAPAPAAPMRPVDPTHIAANPAGGEMWWINGAWQPAPAAPAGMPGMMPPR